MACLLYDPLPGAVAVAVVAAGTAAVAAVAVADMFDMQVADRPVLELPDTVGLAGREDRPVLELVDTQAAALPRE